MRTISIYLTIIVLGVFMFSSCGKIEKLSEVPYIEFTSFSVFDTTDILGNVSKGGCLKFYFEDGDGNVGRIAPTEGDLDSTNMYISAYQKINNEFIKITDSSNELKPSDYRIPYMEKTGQNKIMQGTISVRFVYMFYSVSDSTTLKYTFQIKDRSDNFSNTITTCEIPLSINGTYTN